MIRKVEAEFDSIDLAERAAREMRGKIPGLTAIYIQPSRSKYALRQDEWNWTQNLRYEDGSSGTIIRSLTPGRIYERELHEPDLRNSAYLSCLTDEESAKETSGTLRNLGGIGVRVF